MVNWILKPGIDNVFYCKYGAEELVVKQVRRGVWFARIRGEKEHARWGDKKQIREDVSYFEKHCCLPRAPHRAGW
jgi:hypothetical protein